MTQTFAGLPIAAPREAGLCADRLGRIGHTMDAAVEARQVPGTATVLLRHGQVVHRHASGRLDMDREAPVSMDSLFRMYSQTKPVTAAVVMSLFEDGAFFLDEPVSKWLPEFENPRVAAYPGPAERVRGGLSVEATVPACREITLFDLLTMTSGLPAITRTPAAYAPLMEPTWEGTGFFGPAERVNHPEHSYEEKVLAIADVPLFAQPGETWNYASDFDVLSLFLTRLTGQDLDTLFRERIFEPLGMADSGFYCAEQNLSRLVTEYEWDEDENLRVRERPEDAEKAGGSNRALMSGNGMFGGMLSTPADYARFAQMLLNGGELDGARVLGRKTVDLMTTNHIGTRNIDLGTGPNYGFGFGYSVRKGIGGSFTPGSPGQFGWGGAAGTSFFVDPAEDLAGLFFTQVFLYQFLPKANLGERFEKLTYEALI